MNTLYYRTINQWLGLQWYNVMVQNIITQWSHTWSYSWQIYHRNITRMSSHKRPTSINNTLWYRKWPTKTTTSPLGKHIHIYHTLIKVSHQKPTEGIEFQIDITDKASQIQWVLMNLAIEHCHTYTRWTIVHNNFWKKS